MVSVWFPVVTWLILINYYVTGFMVIHPLVVNNFNKILPRLKANAVSQPTLEPHSLCYTCWVQVGYSLLPLLHFFLLDTLLLLSSCRLEGVRSALPGLRGLLGVRLPVDVPVAPCSASESLSVFVLRFRCIRHFVINVINNIRICFIISFYMICAVIYCNTLI